MKNKRLQLQLVEPINNEKCSTTIKQEDIYFDINQDRLEKMIQRDELIETEIINQFGKKLKYKFLGLEHKLSLSEGTITPILSFSTSKGKFEVYI